MSPPRFTAERREALLVTLAAGASLSSACSTVGVSRQTVHNWAARGRANADAEAIEFATRLDAVRRGAGNGRTAEQEIEETLERGTRRGSVTAARALMALHRRREEQEPEPQLPPGHPLRYTTLDDPFLAISPEELAYLGAPELAQVRAFNSHRRDRAGVIDSCFRWAQWLRTNMRPPYGIEWRTQSPSMEVPTQVGPRACDTGPVTHGGTAP